MLLPFCIFESSCVIVTMKVLLRIVIDFFHLCAKTWKIVTDCVEVSPILLPFGTLFSLNIWSWLHSFFFSCGVQKNKHFLTDKLVFCLFTFSGGHKKLDCSEWTLDCCSCSLLSQHPSGGRGGDQTGFGMNPSSVSRWLQL